MQREPLSDRFTVRLFQADLATIDHIAARAGAGRSLILRTMVRESLIASGDVAEPEPPEAPEAVEQNEEALRRVAREHPEAFREIVQAAIDAIRPNPHTNAAPGSETQAGGVK